MQTRFQRVFTNNRDVPIVMIGKQFPRSIIENGAFQERNIRFR